MASKDEQEYTKKLIQSGIEPVRAAEIASKTVYHSKESKRQEVIEPTGGTISLPGIPESSPLPLHAKTSTNSKAISMTESKKTGRNKDATKALAEKVNEAKKTALLQHTKQEMKDAQLSLFDIAPWGDNMRALPNDYARSALFTVRNKRVARKALQNEPIYSIGDTKITFTGVELRAEDDELIWQQVMEYSKRSPLGEPISFTFYELCKDVGWSINGRYYKKAEECLSRLQASAMQFESNRIGRLESLSLISRFRVLDRGKKTSRCQVMIDEEMVVLFAGDHYSRFIWDKYRKLSPIARRMFDYFSTHKEPFPIKLENFRLMCGSESTRPKKWREQVSSACEELSESDLVSHAWVAEGKLFCRRTPAKDES
ncbi:plasmid replication initiator TrfA [Vibrio parahaemolyticus]|uniref:plasmid replication initiator TrfA n=1 Tax=Vibrio parahaemolyticus TaxID=670 RepID=UPI001121D06E|nr:plasmid replication initiator TrfA [Vibrio parahaemolyticus]MDG2676288.1 plasmid replication initiator TrfA [Vibrio parahaemolyticus]TOA86315.1 transcriptional regulator [Vibrio parahaemolyticus]HBH7899523.1 replication initiator protein A [Vibrio parahaemolyticus]